jgi:predicted ATPase
MVLTPGQTHEMKVAEELLGDIHNAYVIGDRAYSAKALVDALVARGCTVVIPANPTHPQRDYDAHLYKDRHLPCLELDLAALNASCTLAWSLTQALS